MAGAIFDILGPSFGLRTSPALPPVPATPPSFGRGGRARSVSYKVLVKDPNGTTLAILTQFLYLEVAFVVGGVGHLNMDLALGSINESFFMPEGVLEVWRNLNGKSNLVGEKIFLTRDLFKSLKTDGSRLFSVGAPDDNDLLQRRIVANYALTPQAYKQNQTADDMAKDVVTDQFGASATDYLAQTGRAASKLSVQTKVGAAPATSKSMHHQDVLTIVQELSQASYSQGTYMAFDVVSLMPATGISLEFRTYTGQRGIDHRFPGGRPPIILDPELGMITEVQRHFDYTKVANAIYAGGQGPETVRPIKYAQDAASIGLGPFGRIEKFVSANSADPLSVDAQAQAALRANRLHKLYTARFNETDQMQWDIHVGLGDFVTAQLFSESVDCRLDAVAMKLQNGEERVDVMLRADV